MKSLVFDTGPLITLALNNLLWLLKELKEKFGGEFYITKSVARECIDKPLTSKKFKFEALQILKLKQEGIIKEYSSSRLGKSTNELLQLSNNLFKVHDKYITNVQYAEIEAVVASQILGSEAVVIDEFITRMIIEDSMAVKNRMERKLHQRVLPDKQNLALFREKVKGVKVIRSFELVTIAYELGLFEKFYLDIPEPKKTLLDGLLWAVKLNGCSCSEKEIQTVQKIENP